jgi:hypothetical protein
VESTFALIVSPAAGLLGVGLGYFGSRHISKGEREAAGRAEVRRALAAYLGAIYPLVAELRAMPEVSCGRLADAVDRISGEAASYVRSRRQLTKLGSRPFELMDRFVAAAAILRFLELLPAPLQVAISNANGYVEQLNETRSDELKDCWPEIWRELQSATRLLPT